MGAVYTLIYGADSREFVPYNAESIEIKPRYYDKDGAWIFIDEINSIQVIGQDYEWLYNIIVNNKCDKVNVTVHCDGNLHYNGRFNYYTCGFDYDNCIIDIKPVQDSYTTDVLSIVDEEREIMSLVADETIILLGPGYVYNNAKRLTTVIDGFLAGTGVTLQSQLLQNAISPALLDFPAGTFQPPFDWYSTHANPFEKLYLTLPNIQDERSMRMSLTSLLAKLQKSLNIRWTIDNANAKLIVENVEYFKRGLKYTLPVEITRDLTVIDGGRWLGETNKIKYTQTTFPITERRDPMYGGQNANYGVIMVNECVMEGAVHEAYRCEFEYDPEVIEAEGVDCIMLLACYVNLGNTYVFEHHIGPVGINNFPFTSYIMIEYWLFDRYFDRVYAAIGAAGWWNTKSRREIRLQENVDVPVCCPKINPYSLVTTQFGNGLIHEYSYNPTTGMGKFSIKYADI